MYVDAGSAYLTKCVPSHVLLLTTGQYFAQRGVQRGDPFAGL